MSLARVGVGGGGGDGYRHSHQVAASCCVEGEKKQQQLPVMVMAEAPKAVQAKGVAPPVESAVQVVEKVKAPQPEPEAQEKEEEQQEEYDVEEFLAQHQDLVDGMLAEGFLDDQFSQLQMLQDKSTPNFVEEVVTLFF